MPYDPLRLRYLFEKYARNDCSLAELREFWSLMHEHAGEGMPDEEMKTWWDREAAGRDPAALVDGQKLFQRIMEEEKAFRSVQRRRDAGRRLWLRWAAAAAVILLLGGGYFLGRHHTSRVASDEAGMQAHDVPAPQTNRAVITLMNGRQVYLDDARKGTLARQGGVKVIKRGDGEIAYDRGGGEYSGGTLGYNTLSNPRGSKVVGMTLADGSRVWLNAASSITYPVAFTGKERTVSITGEAYFEVVHDPRAPFRVKAGNMVVEDIGTRFDINAYGDEPVLKTTLIEGAVKITLQAGTVRGGDERKSVFLKPGQQATLIRDAGSRQQIRIIKQVHAADAIAWKNGQFRFNSVDIATIMRQAARWYNVDIVYEGKVNGTISGGISRGTNMSGLLHLLELTGKVKFTIAGRKIIVQPVHAG